jgi:hypothetical protein
MKNDNDWTETTESITLSDDALVRIAELVANPPPPSMALKRAFRRYEVRVLAKGTDGSMMLLPLPLDMGQKRV